MAKKAEPQELTNDLPLTQWGEKGKPFRKTLREGELDMSLMMDRRSPMGAALSMSGSCGPLDAVRYTTVGLLREAGFVVEHTPTGRNPCHVSVTSPNPGDGVEEWNLTLADAFDKCFTEV